MYQHLYQKFLQGHEGKTHFAAHSHHFWPDVSLDGHMQYWQDAANFSDAKWNHILGEKLDQAQKHIAKMLNLKNPQNLAFASNTHELLTRLLSSFMGQEKIKVLTTDSEFHSFSRQIKRLDEFDQYQVTYLESSHADFATQLIEHAGKDYDLIFLSHVFFNSGKVLDLSLVEKCVEAKPDKTVLCLDAYHGFCAIPTDLSKLEDKIFYLAGGYKYAQAGEGMCFMAIPSQCELRPAYTGWFASFSTLEDEASDEIQYDNNGWRFWGSTQDFSGMYRFVAVWDELTKQDLSLTKIHKHIQSLQEQFIQHFKASDKLINRDLSCQGHFLTLKTKNYNDAQKAHEYLLSEGILTDFRGDCLRFGFGLYLTSEDVKSCLDVINSDSFQEIIK
jgi:selenocysteine lyase/cysteine desulfurase